GRADQGRQTLHAAPGGEDAQLHFRQSKAGARLIDAEPVTAGEGEFQTTTDAVPVDQGKGGIVHAFEALEGVPAAADQFGDAVGRGDRIELVDVGAGNESAFFQRMNHEPGRAIALEVIEYGV